MLYSMFIINILLCLEEVAIKDAIFIFSLS